jgi:phage pi2 protein 07
MKREEQHKMEDFVQKYSYQNKKLISTVQNQKHLQERLEIKNGVTLILFTKMVELGTIVFPF